MNELSISSCIIVVLLIKSCLTAADKTLFDENDSVIVYREDNYKRGLYDGKTAHLFLLYSSWCGHCQRFAPTYKELAKDIENWSDIVLVTGIDCVYDTKACQKYKVRGYPTIRFIGPTTNTSAEGVSYEGSRTIDKIKEWVIESVSGVVNPPASWPNLYPLSEEEAERALSSNEDTKETHIVAMVADELMGKELVLELHGQIPIRYALTTSTMAQTFKSESLSVLRISGGRIVSVKEVAEDWNARVIAEFIKRSWGSSSTGVVEENHHGETDQDIDDGEINTTLQYKLYEVDMQSAINNALYTEVGLKINFTDVELSDLKSFLHVALGCGSWSLDYQNQLAQIEREVSTLDSLDSEKWREILAGASKTGFPRDSTFIGCRGSKPTTRGYTCGLWVLFHTMLSSCYSPSNSTSPSSVDVLRSIHGYVSSFFTCSHCRTHFLAMSERMGLLSVTDNKAAVLALWQAHNQVNARLSKEPHDPYFPKVQFPPESECSDCSDDSTGRSGQFDTDEVFGYLLRHYRRVLTPYGKIRITNQRRKSSNYSRGKKKKGEGNKEHKNKGRGRKGKKGKGRNSVDTE